VTFSQLHITVDSGTSTSLSRKFVFFSLKKNNSSWKSSLLYVVRVKGLVTLLFGLLHFDQTGKKIKSSSETTVEGLSWFFHTIAPEIIKEETGLFLVKR